MIVRVTAACLVAVLAFTVAAAAQPPQAPPFSFVSGTWFGKVTAPGGLTLELQTKYKSDGSYSTVVISGNFVASEQGRYTYQDGLLTVESNGSRAEYLITVIDANRVRSKGNGLQGEFQRK